MQPVSLSGKTKKYAGNGRKFGYPTANIDVPTELTDGVYFGFANLSGYQHQPALIFVGVPTTVGDQGRRVEAHLLDARDRDYYDLPLELDVVQFHRPNKKLQSIDELIEIMKDDERIGRQWFATLPKKVN